MNQTTTGWMLFIAAMGMMASMISMDVGKLTSWQDASAPAFIGAILAHLGAVVAAFVGGKMIPVDRDPMDRTRLSDAQK